MALLIDDPGHVGLRRGVRTAVGTTVAMALTITLLPGTPATVLAAFGSMALLGTADFGGGMRRRTVSLLATGIAGAVLVVIGGLAALSVPSIVIVTFLVTGGLAFLVALRGSFANASPALTIVYVASAMVATSVDSIGPLLIGWGIAIAVAIPVTLLVLPRRDLAPVRTACVAALRAVATLISDRSQGKPLDYAAVTRAIEDLQAAYLGNPFRAAGLRAPDRALLVLVGQVEALLTAIGRGGGYLKPVSSLARTGELVRQSAECLHSTAEALAMRTPAPSAEPLVDLWQEQWDGAVTALADSSLGTPSERVDLVDRAFPDRAMAISVVRLNILVRRVLGQPSEHFNRSEHTIPEPPLAHPWRELADQVSLRSPWMRLALRTGVGLALAALVVEIIGIDHGFWVLLGVVATLRMDGVATLKTSLLALAGTFAGALIGYGLLVAEGTHPAAMWAGLVLVTFLAVYTQATTAYIIGQAAFSLFVIVAFSIANWPPDLDVAVQRIEDIAYGAGISVAVALLMWPRGVVAGLRGNVADAIRRANDVLVGAVTDLVNGGQRVTSRELLESSASFSRSEEVVEVSLASKQADAVSRANAWQLVIDNLRTLTVGGHLIAGWSNDRPPVSALVPALGPPLLEDAHATTLAWARTADMIDDIEPGPAPAPTAFIDTARAVAAQVDLSQAPVADRIVGAVWTHGWIHMAYNAAISAQVPVNRR
ncbi:MAG: inner membrane protein YccS [Actinomycetota bacterium]